MLRDDIKKVLELSFVKRQAMKCGKPQYEVAVDRDFDKFLVHLRQIFNNWKKIEEHVRMRGLKTIHSTFQSILDKIKLDTASFAMVLEGVAQYAPEEDLLEVSDQYSHDQ